MKHYKTILIKLAQGFSEKKVCCFKKNNFKKTVWRLGFSGQNGVQNVSSLKAYGNNFFFFQATVILNGLCMFS